MPPLEPLASPPASPPPSWGRDREGGIAEQLPQGFPPPLTPPHKGEGDSETPDPAGTIWRDGAFRRDAWAKVAADAPLPDGPVIVSKPRFLADRAVLTARRTPVGLLLAPGESLDDLAADLPRFAVIALDFPKYSDGRAFSTARLLREKYRYSGELRAVGNVLNDQIAFMRRVGFDTLEVTHAPTRRALIEGRIADVTLHYQPATLPEPPAGTRPWLRRSAR